MASPVIQRGASQSISTAAAQWPITVVGNESTTDLAVLLVRTGSAVTVSVTGGCTTWTQLMMDNADATDDNTYVFYGRYDINFAGDIRINLSGASKGVWILYTIRGAADPATLPPQVSARQIFTTAANSGNAPAFSPTGGSKDYLFITAIAYGGTGTTSNIPTGYNGSFFYGSATTGNPAAGNAGLYAVTKAATAATEDAGVWTHAAANLGGIAFTIAVYPPAGPSTLFGATAMALTFGKDIKGSRRTFGQIDRPFTFGAVVQGKRKAFGQLALPITFSKEVDGRRKTFGKLLSPYIFGKAVSATKTTFGRIDHPITIGIATAGFRVGITYYGQVELPITFNKDVKGIRRAFGQVAFPITFSKDVRGQRTTFGQIVFPIIFTKEAVGRKNVFGQLSMPTIFGKETSGRRKTFGQVALPLIFSKSVSGQRKTFGRVALPINVLIYVDGIVHPRHYGSLSLPIVFDKQIIGQRETFGQINAPYFLGSAIQGQRQTFSSLDFPMELFFDIREGHVGAHGELSLSINMSMETIGYAKSKGVILNTAQAIFLGTIPVQAVYVDDQKVWPMT